MRKFELALHPTKTRLIRFGRHAAKHHLNGSIIGVPLFEHIQQPNCGQREEAP
jgi:hypothetical protein